jgi:nucleoside-diphosphate-sugar epimerase
MAQVLTVVLGGSGDIGSVLVEDLKENQVHYLAPTSQQVDLTDAESTEKFFSSLSEPYSVVFAAFLDRRQGDNEQTFESNIMMIENVISFATPTSLVFLSSMDVYGKNPELPITEKTLTDSTSFYSRAKLFAEARLTQTFAEKISLLVLRLPGVYGGHGPRNSALDRILAKGMKERMIDIGDGGSLLRDWIYAGEVSRFLIEWLSKPIAGTFNFATGESWTINRFVSECLSDLSEIKHVVKVVDEIKKTQSGADHIFDNQNFSAAFPCWEFESRFSSLNNFSKSALDHLNKVKIDLNK